MKSTKKDQTENSVSEKRFNRVMKMIKLGFTILSVSTCFAWKVMSDKHQALETESSNQARKEEGTNNQLKKDETIINQLIELIKFHDSQIDSLGIIINGMNEINGERGNVNVSGSTFKNCIHAIETHSNIIMQNKNGEK